MELRPAFDGAGGVIAGATLRLAIEVRGDDGFPQSPQPDSVTVQVVSEDESVEHLAAAAMTLQSVEVGQATAATATVVTDAAKAWRRDAWRGDVIRITAGTGAGQERRIRHNTPTTVTIEDRQIVGGAAVGPFAPAPDATSVYAIHRSEYRHGWAVPDAREGEVLVAVFRATDAAPEAYVAATKAWIPVVGPEV